MPHTRTTRQKTGAPQVQDLRGSGQMVREGGVEPPRPCGHWNLNPARLPIPPPAHWVCPPAPAIVVLAPSDIEKISTVPRVGSHPFPVRSGAVLPQARPPLCAGPRPVQQTRPRLRTNGHQHVSTSYRYRPSVHRRGRVHSPVRDTVLGPPLRSSPRGVRRGAPKGTSGRSTPVGRAARGNQPISLRVDTISKQYQAGGGAPRMGTPHVSSMSSTRTYVGGGATWES